ncbi:hypothetical protein Ddc_14374 [Ditylenchus destructor]|nr:hypothetical protein Ddc_14374 [Ditylenchus destructor]
MDAPKYFPLNKCGGWLDGMTYIHRIRLNDVAICKLAYLESPNLIWFKLTNEISDKLQLTKPYTAFIEIGRNSLSLLMCFKRRDRSKKGNQVVELKEKRKEDVPAVPNTVSTSGVEHQNHISTITARQASISTPVIGRQNRGLTPVTARQDPFPTPVIEGQKLVSPPENRRYRRLGMSPVSRSRVADLKKDRLKVEERKDLEDVIMRIRDGKKQSWESKFQRGKSLTYAEIRDKEVAEAEWRWIFRRNRAFQLGEDYQTNKFLEDYMRDLETRGFDEELRNAQTLVSRPYLYERMKDEKKAAEMRYSNRVRGLPVPSFERLGIEITKLEIGLNRPEPEPLSAYDGFVSANSRPSAARTVALSVPTRGLRLLEKNV